MSEPQHDNEAEALALQRLMRHRAKPVYTPGNKLSLRIAKVMRPYAKDDGPGLPLIQRRWQDLVGPRLAKLSRPVKLTGKKEERILTLEILPSASPIFQHQNEMLKQRLAAACGGFLKDIKLVQKASTGRSPTGKAASPPLSARDREEIKAGLDEIKNPQLSAALLAFGEAVYTQDR